jgi:iron complex outermembrane receptor protein
VSAGEGSLTLHGDYSYRSREQFQLVASPFDQPGYGLLGARLTFRDTARRWSVALFGTNLTDKRYRGAGRDALNDVGFANSLTGMPRQIGVELRAGF